MTIRSDIQNISLPNKSKISDALTILEKYRKKIVLIIDEKKKLEGIVVDGDIRRALIKGLPLNTPLTEIMNTAPLILDDDVDQNEAISFMRKNGIQQLPVVDIDGQVINILELNELSKSLQHDNWVVIMAGGEGRRLRPLTNDIPKPMLKVGSRPILETIIRQFVSHGFKKFILSVNYLSHTIEDHFGDGKEFGVEIKYIRETEKMGTAGSLSLLEFKPTSPFIVMNGDILTNVNFSNLIKRHEQLQPAATMCVREYKIEVPFGVVEVTESEDQITALHEKPSTLHYINAGIYILAPEVLKQIPKNIFFDMTDLFSTLISENSVLLPYVVHEYWADIGRFSDYEKVNSEYATIFAP
ncbi:nucleotidyltransferase family protein [Curvivirga aplysinae]|uniref:nucleotidyltransferase family protein n=1 Tax=Curvivirga aplysinae TaxID=2529852 RepID=UPI0012BC3EE8|nr:nucleotidyltransferase family protein [Curvivirga aplysinae]MTI11391.1 CBS domain-containing protein [Curvivirga aplysinae]